MNDEPNCPNCGGILSPVTENNGFTMPEGPEKWETTGYKCGSCGRSYSFEEVDEAVAVEEGGQNGR